MAEEKFNCPICAEPIMTDDEIAEAKVKSMNWETHADCMMEVLNQ